MFREKTFIVIDDVKTSIDEQRVLVLAPVGRDAALLGDVLQKQSMSCLACRDIQQLTQECERGAGLVILTEESLTAGDGALIHIIRRQPQWSDIPILLLTRRGVDSSAVHAAIASLPNVTLHERPVRITALISATRGALRARNRQYQIREYLQERDEANQRKDEFLATLAHELRNPLAPISNAVHLLRLVPDQSRIIDMMERQINHMIRLVDDLMEISRITRGKIKLVKQNIDLLTVIDSAIEASLPLIEQGNHVLVRPEIRKSAIVDADHTRLAQVFSNLLNNAAKFSDPGSIISVHLQIQDNFAFITVADTGIGIPPHQLENLFEMFRQGNLNSGRSNSGLGIGLCLSRKLVEMHGGTLTAQSEGEGKGSEFTVSLPVVDAVPEMASPAGNPEQLEHRRILVVDDNRDAAESLGDLLRLLGAEVSVAFDGPAALSMMADFGPEAILLDLGMPGMDGYEVANRIRQNSNNRNIALIALTGWGQDNDRERTMKAGFAHHLVKPVDIDEIKQILGSLDRSLPQLSFQGDM